MHLGDIETIYVICIYYYCEEGLNSDHVTLISVVC